MSITTFNYAGRQQEYTVPYNGLYQIEVWGAEGGGSRTSGNSSSGPGGLGGYVKGTVKLKKGTKLYIHVGGQGGNNTNGVAYGGYNGGGSGYASSQSEPGNGGGGATDVRLISGAWDNAAGLLSRIIVAGGGGGGGEDPNDSYAHGGGVTGLNASGSCSNGTQKAAGTGGGFGYGGSTNKGDGGGGGGGWYGGGTESSPTVGDDTSGGGGGSGYVLTSTSFKPTGYTPTSEYYFTDTYLEAGAQLGHGKCVITFLYDDTNMTIYTFDYTGSKQEFVVPYTGLYRLEVWGAEGGRRSSSGTSTYGGKGGYSTGEINLKKGEVLNIFVGGDGSSTGKGWNGGGVAGYPNVYGGGGTDIRYQGTELNNRIIVAGGGGSVGAANKAGGYGGGSNGESRTDSFGSGGQGGTQAAGGAGYSAYPLTAGSLGQGGRGYSANDGYGGAGGGGYYGGAGSYPDSSGDDDRGGGGGSGYVNKAILNSAATYAGNTSFPAPGTNLASKVTGNSGHGKCRIVSLLKTIPPVYVNVNGTWKEAIPYVNVNGTWKEASPNVNANGTWKNL